ncbi:hypothetical protein Vretimale_6198 [Volvox reticuliferus]|uniref:Protein SirB1 N-terminal domain-containing protein n=1 Tax=Volvox reticuliferus TaxID=1737510 RepID=A0A8J4LLG1_9CHLO|nr:hypothetical protein Vretifemale_8007 [Volvox reticuliferus]GIM01377.1 hypothetical protein Vretimale_6198 [Volvox reticuliferus]
MAPVPTHTHPHTLTIATHMHTHAKDYYNADNSCINQVMERRVGIPITLSLVYSEVARRVGLPMRGLNLPGHFMLQPLWPPARHHPSATSPSLHSGRGSSGGYGREEDQQQQPGSDSGHLVGGLEVQNPQPAAGGGGGDDGGGGGGGAAAAPVAAAANDKSMGMAVTAPAEQKGGTKEAADGDPPFGRAAKQEEEDEEEEDTGGPLEVLVDAFRSGEVCLPGEAEERISAVLGSPVRIDPTVLKESQPLHPRMFLLRMLSNLRSIYLSTQQIELLLDVLKFMRVTLQAEERMEEEEEGGDGGVQGRSHSRSSSPPPFNPTSSFFGDSFPLVAAAASLARDEGLCYFALRRYPECLEALREYLRLAEQTGNGPLPAEEAKTVAVVMEEARRRMTQQRQ